MYRYTFSSDTLLVGWVVCQTRSLLAQSILGLAMMPLFLPCYFWDNNGGIAGAYYHDDFFIFDWGD